MHLRLLLQGQTGPRMHDLSPEPVVHLSQHKLLPLLLHRAQNMAGLADIRFGHHLQLFQQQSTGVTCSVQPLQVTMFRSASCLLSHMANPSLARHTRG